MLYRSVHNPTGINVTPNFAEAIQEWDGEGLPDDRMVELFVKDLAVAKKNREIGKTVGNLATRINYEIPGSRSLFTSTARKAKNIKEGPYLDALIKINKKWENPAIWLTLQRASKEYTASFYLAALDRKYDEKGKIVRADELYQIYIPILTENTLAISGHYADLLLARLPRFISAIDTADAHVELINDSSIVAVLDILTSANNRLDCDAANRGYRE